jgi:hypothetical protein
MHLSLNPASWSISNLAEAAVQGLTGNKGLADIAGLATAAFTGDVKGIAQHGKDLIGDVGRAAKAFTDGFSKAASDAVKAFSNPGAVGAPNVAGCKCPGYSNSPSNTSQTGMTPPKSISNLEGESLDSILNNPGLSLESKIMFVLLKLQGEKRKEMKDRLKASVDARQGGDGATVDVKTGTGGTTKVDAQGAQQLLQQSANELNELSQMSTNMLKLFHDMKMATISNIR